MKKKLIGFSLKPIFRLLVAMSIIAFVASITAVSCGKTPAANNNNNNSGGNNSGGGGNGGGGDGNGVVIDPDCGTNPTTGPVIKITAKQAAVTAGLFKVDSSNCDMKINGTKLVADTQPYGQGTVPLIRVTNAVRLIDEKNANLPALFDIELMRNSTTAAEGGIVLVVGNVTGFDTNTNNITLRSVANSQEAASGDLVRSAVPADANADKEGVWKRSVPTAGANFFQLVSFVRVHSAQTIDTDAGGSTICATAKLTGVHDGATATDATKLPFAKATCYFGVYNGDSTARISEINDDWIDHGATTKEAEFRVMGIYTGNTGLGSLSGATGWDKSSFFGAQDNAAVKAIIAKNKYVEKTFKITIVKSSGF